MKSSTLLLITAFIITGLSACSSTTRQNSSNKSATVKETKVAVFTSTSSEPVAKVGDAFTSENIIYTVQDENSLLTLECSASEKASTPGFVVALFCNNFAKSTLIEKQKEGYLFKDENTDKPFGNASDAIQSLPDAKASNVKLVKTFPYKK